MLISIAMALVSAQGSFDLCPSPDFSVLGEKQVAKQVVEPPVSPILIPQSALLTLPAVAAPVYYYSSPVVTNKVSARLFRSAACNTGKCR
jgi:hypothetical protein